MKHAPKLTGTRLLKKALLFLVAATVLLFSACSQQPTPNQGVESQGLGNWSFPGRDVTDDGLTMSVTTDSNNYPIVAYKDDDNNLIVKRWSGTSWQNMGGSLIATNFDWQEGAVLVKNGNAPLIAYNRKSSLGNYRVYVKRWNGSSWTSYGSGPLNIDPAKSATQPTLVVDSSGNPVVAWTEQVPVGNLCCTRKVFVKRWNGSGWDLLSTSGIVNASQPHLAIGENGQLFLAYVKCAVCAQDEDLYVARWEQTSNTWKVIGQTLEVNANAFSKIYDLQLAVHNNQPVVAWKDNSDYHLHMKRYLPCSAFGCIPVWLDLGRSDTTAAANYQEYPFTLAVNSAGEPIVAYWTSDGPGSRVFVSRVVSANNWSYVGDERCLNAGPRGAAALSVTGMNYTLSCNSYGVDVFQFQYAQLPN